MTQIRVIKEGSECALVHFWQDLWESPRRGKKGAFDALDACLAIELAVARFCSLNTVGFWGDISEIVQSTTGKIDLLKKLEVEIANKINLNGVNLRPFPWEALSDNIQESNDQQISILNYLASLPSHQFSGDFLGQIYQTWESEGTKTGKGSYYTSEKLARNLLQTMDLRTIKKILTGNVNDKPIICDPACGSGIFFLELARAITPSQNFEGIGDRLEIRGFDIDPIAVWICRLNLIIWNILQPAQAIKLIAHRNAVTDDSITTKEYDLIIGNPPFFEVPASDYPELLNACNPPRRVNISALFALKYAPLLRDEGQLGFIFPRAFLFSDRWVFLRKILAQGGYHLPYLTLYNRGFSRVGLEQITLTVKHGGTPADVTIAEYDDLQESGPSSNWSIPGNLVLRPPLFSLPLFATTEVREIMETVWKNSVPLGKLCDVVPGTSDPAIFRGMGWEQHLQLEDSPPTWLAIKGTDIIPFGVKKYRYIIRPTGQSSVSANSARLRFIFERPVVVCQRLVSSKTHVVAARLPPNCVPISTLSCICLPPPSSNLTPLVISVLNSTFMSYYVADHVFLHSRLSTSLDKEYMRNLPIPNPSNLDTKQMRSVSVLESHLADSSHKQSVLFLPPKDLQQLDSQIFACFGLSETQGHLITQKLQAFWNHEYRSRNSHP